MPESSSVETAVTRRDDSRLCTCVLLMLSAIAWLLAWPPLDLWPMTFLWAALLIRATLHARHFWWMSLFCLVFYAVAWSWLLRWTQEVSVAGYPAMVLYSAAWMVFFVWCLRWFAQRRFSSRIPLAVMAPVLWVSLEYLRAEIFFGAWPWYLAGHPLIEWPLLCQVAELGGVWVVSMLVLCVGGALADWMRPAMAGTRVLTSTITAVVVVIFTVSWGVIATSREAGPVMGRFLMVQTDIPQNNKLRWSVQDQIDDVGLFMELTAAGLRESGGADVVVWPETMLPGIGFEPSIHESLQARQVTFSGLSPAFWRDGILKFADAIETPMLVGTNTWAGSLAIEEGPTSLSVDPEWQYNSLVLLEPTGTQSYHKEFPTPFGERLPWIDSWPWLRTQLLELGAQGLSLQLDAGPPLDSIELDVKGQETIRIVTPICFEATVPSLVRDQVLRGERTADLIINVSNDGWFGEVDGGRLVHAQSARFRCIELSRPMLRCANTGQSAWFDSRGRLVESLPMREAGSLLAMPRLDSRRTLYAMIGNMVPISCLVLVFLSFLVSLGSRSTT